MSYRAGENYVACERCGFKRLASECRKTWDGWVVCADTCWEEKHPALIPHKLEGDKQRAKVVRMPNEYFIEPPEKESP